MHGSREFSAKGKRPGLGQRLCQRYRSASSRRPLAGALLRRLVPRIYDFGRVLHGLCKRQAACSHWRPVSVRECCSKGIEECFCGRIDFGYIKRKRHSSPFPRVVSGLGMAPYGLNVSIPKTELGLRPGYTHQAFVFCTWSVAKTSIGNSFGKTDEWKIDGTAKCEEIVHL